MENGVDRSYMIGVYDWSICVSVLYTNLHPDYTFTWDNVQMRGWMNYKVNWGSDGQCSNWLKLSHERSMYHVLHRISRPVVKLLLHSLILCCGGLGRWVGCRQLGMRPPHSFHFVKSFERMGSFRHSRNLPVTQVFSKTF